MQGVGHSAIVGAIVGQSRPIRGHGAAVAVENPSPTAESAVAFSAPPIRGRCHRHCRENDLLASNANPAEFSVERLFSLNYVERTFFPRLVAGLAFFFSNEALACGFHPW
jgi:hypothetical protein